MSRKKGKGKQKAKTVCVVDEPVNEVKTDITLTIEEQPYIEMMQYAHEFSPNECSGVGLVEKVDFDDGSVIFNVTKVFLPLQVNTGVSTNIDDDELNKLNTELVEAGEDTSQLKFHWHSHVDMSVFHSGTDDENYDEMQTGDYAVSLVVNKAYDMLGSVHLYNPLRVNVLNIRVAPPDNVDLDEYVIPKDLRKKIEEAVERNEAYELEHTPKVVYYGNSGRQKHVGYNPSWYDDDFYATNYSTGLSLDYDFSTLLKEGEKQGLFTLFYDLIDPYTIVGYMNNRTQDCYELESSLEATRFNFRKQRLLGTDGFNSSIGKAVQP